MDWSQPLVFPLWAFLLQTAFTLILAVGIATWLLERYDKYMAGKQQTVGYEVLGNAKRKLAFIPDPREDGSPPIPIELEEPT